MPILLSLVNVHSTHLVIPAPSPSSRHPSHPLSSTLNSTHTFSRSPSHHRSSDCIHEFYFSYSIIYSLFVFACVGLNWLFWFDLIWMPTRFYFTTIFTICNILATRLAISLTCGCCACVYLCRMVWRRFIWHPKPDILTSLLSCWNVLRRSMPSPRYCMAAFSH